jgi:uncharacterized iron-regulated protein
MADETPLGAKMRRLADADHAQAEELRVHADAFEAAVSGYYAEPQTVTAKQFLSAFARARMLWCKCSGEALL